MLCFWVMCYVAKEVRGCVSAVRENCAKTAKFAEKKFVDIESKIVSSKQKKFWLFLPAI